MPLAPVLLAADNVAGQTVFLRDIPPGKYADFFVRFSGNAAGALSWAIADLGRVRFTEAGRDIINADVDFLRAAMALEPPYGSGRLVITAGGASSVTLRIPRGYGDRNVHQVIESDVLQCQLNFGPNFTTNFTGADKAILKVYGNVRETGEMAYNLLLHQIDENLAGGTFMLPVRHENVCAIYVERNANLTRLRLVKDGTEMANVQEGAVANEDNDLADISDIMSGKQLPIDTAALPIANSGAAKLGIAEAGEIGEFLSDDIGLEFTMGAAQVQSYIVASADFTPAKLRQTKIETAAVVQRKVARKNTLGRGRPVQTLTIAAQ